MTGIDVQNFANALEEKELLALSRHDPLLDLAEAGFLFAILGADIFLKAVDGVLQDRQHRFLVRIQTSCSLVNNQVLAGKKDVRLEKDV